MEQSYSLSEFARQNRIALTTVYSAGNQVEGKHGGARAQALALCAACGQRVGVARTAAAGTHQCRHCRSRRSCSARPSEIFNGDAVADMR
jgi:DNA-directed RNA polymerase subunit RPC12/RpoP